MKLRLDILDYKEIRRFSMSNTSFLDEQHVVSLAEIRRNETRGQFLTSDKKMNKKNGSENGPLTEFTV